MPDVGAGRLDTFTSVTSVPAGLLGQMTGPAVMPGRAKHGSKMSGLVKHRYEESPATPPDMQFVALKVAVT